MGEGFPPFQNKEISLPFSSKLWKFVFFNWPNCTWGYLTAASSIISGNASIMHFGKCGGQHFSPGLQAQVLSFVNWKGINRLRYQLYQSLRTDPRIYLMPIPKSHYYFFISFTLHISKREWGIMMVASHLFTLPPFTLCLLYWTATHFCL